MRVILMSSAGTSDVLQLREIPLPALSSRKHLRVRLAAAGINPLDTQLARLCNLSLNYELMLAPQLMKLHKERVRVRQRQILEQGAQLEEAGKLKLVLTMN